DVISTSSASLSQHHQNPSQAFTNLLARLNFHKTTPKHSPARFNFHKVAPKHPPSQIQLPQTCTQTPTFTDSTSTNLHRFNFHKLAPKHPPSQIQLPQTCTQTPTFTDPSLPKPSQSGNSYTPLHSSAPSPSSFRSFSLFLG
ncbi:hypothetical protein M758_UG127600, partial [Ceratodon purpureus]